MSKHVFATFVPLAHSRLFYSSCWRTLLLSSIL